ncbi:MAG: CsbD family protein [Gammaproteobacteria bacterium]
MDTDIKDIVQGSWDEIKGKIKKQWGKLTDDEILKMEGRYDELSGCLQRHYGYKESQARDEIAEFLRKNKLNS